MKRIITMGILIVGVWMRVNGSLSYALLALYAAAVGVRTFLCLRRMKESGLHTQQEKDTAFFRAMMVAGCVICLIVMHPAYLRQTRCINPMQRLLRERGIKGRVSTYERQDGDRGFSYQGADTSRDALEAIKKTEEEVLDHVKIPENASVVPSGDTYRIDGKAYKLEDARWEGETYDCRKQRPLKRRSQGLLRILFLLATGGVMADALYVFAGGGQWPIEKTNLRAAYGTMVVCFLALLWGNLYPALKYRIVSEKKAEIEKVYDKQEKENFYSDIRNAGKRYNAFGQKASGIFRYVMPLIKNLDQHYKTLKGLLEAGKDPGTCPLTIDTGAFEDNNKRLSNLLGGITEEEKKAFPETYASIVYLNESYFELFEALRGVETYDDLRGDDVDRALGDFLDAEACFDACVKRDKLLLEAGLRKIKCREVE